MDLINKNTYYLLLINIDFNVTKKLYKFVITPFKVFLKTLDNKNYIKKMISSCIWKSNIPIVLKYNRGCNNILGRSIFKYNNWKYCADSYSIQHMRNLRESNYSIKK